MAGWTTPRTWVAGEVVTAPQLNAHVRDNLKALNGFVRKTADESVSSSTVLQNDNELAIAIPAAGTYIIDLHLTVMSAANGAGHLRLGASFPTGTCTLLMDALDAGLASSVIGTLTRQSATITSGTDHVIGLGTSTATSYAHMKFLLVAAAAGTFQFMWAQVASNGNATTVKANSFLTMQQVA